MSLKSAAANGILADNVGCALALARHLVDPPDDDNRLSRLGGADEAADCLTAAAAAVSNDEDDDDGLSCLSHSSSLESISRPPSLADSPSRAVSERRRCSSTVATVSRSSSGSFASTTSCSVDSFELTTLAEDKGKVAVEPIEKANNINQRLSKIRADVHEIDSLMPVVDFEKIESCLLKEAEDRSMAERRRLVSDEVRRRLAADDWCEADWHCCRPSQSTLLSKAQLGNNLQVCFINDSHLSAERDDDVDEAVVDENCLQKSRSTPNLGQSLAATCAEAHHCTMSASQLRKISEADQEADFASRQKRLEKEALLLLTKAQQAARMQMEVERQARLKSDSTDLCALIGLPLDGQKKLSRSQLTKMSTTCLQIILNNLYAKIREYNDELVQLLVQKDTLHMEQDSKLVDIADLLQHQSEGHSTVENAVAPGAATWSKYKKILQLFRR